MIVRTVFKFDHCPFTQLINAFEALALRDPSEEDCATVVELLTRGIKDPIANVRFNAVKALRKFAMKIDPAGAQKVRRSRFYFGMACAEGDDCVVSL